MNLFGLFQISGSALRAERVRAEVVTSNLANAETTRTPEGGPYQRRMVAFNSRPASQFRLLLAHSLPGGGFSAAGGVEVSDVAADPTPPLRRYEPGHPDADESGYVAYPAINPVQEMVDLMGAQRSYELNASAVQAAKQVMQHLENLNEVGRGIAVAFVATVYGVGSANLFFLPSSGKLRIRIREEQIVREMTLEGVISILEGMNPRMLETKLLGFLKDASARPLKGRAH